MTSLRAWAAPMGLVAVMLCSCGPSGGGRTASSSPPPQSGAPAAGPAPSAPPASDTAVTGAAAASALSPAAAPAPAAKKPPSAAELLRDYPSYAAKERAIEALYQNAKERDPTGQVEREQASALAQRRACADKACLDNWFRRREAALKQYVEN